MLRQIIAEETRRVLREGRYDRFAAAVLAAEEDESEDFESSPEADEFLETFKNAVAPVIDDELAVAEEVEAAVAAFKAAGATLDDIEELRLMLDLSVKMVAADLSARSEDMAHEVERDRLRAKAAADEAAFEAIIVRLGSDKAFMAKLVPLLNKKLSATKSSEKSAASKAVTAAVGAAMTDEDFEVTDPIKVHNEIQRRLLAHMERKRRR